MMLRDSPEISNNGIMAVPLPLIRSFDLDPSASSKYAFSLIKVGSNDLNAQESIIICAEAPESISTLLH